MMLILCSLGVLFLAGVNSQGSCPHGFVQNEQSCYMFSHGYMSWIEAEESCMFFNKNAHLAKIDGDTEHAFIAARSVTDREYYWIGLNDRLVDGEYVWEPSGELLSGLGYWGKGEPDAAFDKNCVYYYYEEGVGKWSDTHCENKQAYVCELEMVNVAVG